MQKDYQWSREYFFWGKKTNEPNPSESYSHSKMSAVKALSFQVDTKYANSILGYRKNLASGFFGNYLQSSEACLHPTPFKGEQKNILVATNMTRVNIAHLFFIHEWLELSYLTQYRWTLDTQR